MSDITKIKVDGELESTYKLFSKNREFEKRAGGNGGSQSGVQPDWNQNDDTKPDYVKNRPFYTDAVETVFVEQSTVTFAENNGLYMAEFPSTFEATVGETYKVYWDGSAYECTCVVLNHFIVIGNLSIAGAGSDTGEPFAMRVTNGKGIMIATADTSASHTFSIVGHKVVKIDAKYLPENLDLATKSEVKNVKSTALDAKTIALGAQTTADTAKTTADTAKTTADTAKTTADGCVKINNAGSFKIRLNDNSYFHGSDTNGNSYYAFRQKSVTDTPIVLSIGASGGTDFSISVTPSTSPTVKIKPPVYLNKLADIEIASYSGIRPQITGLGGITMYSSTDGSTKKFKITVDDSGNLTATEVT